MEFFFDIDGVILDFEKGFMDHIRKVYKPDLPQGYRPKSWEMETEFDGVDIGLAWDEFVEGPHFKRLECLVDISLFNRMAEHHPVHLVTNLTPQLKSAREQNLRYHGLEFNSLNLGGHYDFGIEGYPSKSAIVQELHDPSKRMIFADDHPRNCEDIQRTFKHAEVFLVTRPHNAKEDHPFKRIDTLNELLKQLAP